MLLFQGHVACLNFTLYGLIGYLTAFLSYPVNIIMWNLIVIQESLGCKNKFEFHLENEILELFGGFYKIFC